MIALSKRNFLVGLSLGTALVLLSSQMQNGTWSRTLFTEDSDQNKEIHSLKEEPIRKKFNSLKLPVTTETLIIKEDAPKDSERTELPKLIEPVTTEKSEETESCVYPPITNVEQFFDYENKEKKLCTNLVMFGGPKKKIKGKYYDGGKYVCLDKEYDFKEGNCTVLSFGIAVDWSFDDAMDKYGCKVYSFDPTIAKKDHNRSENIQFFSLGLSDSKKVIQFSKKKEGQVDRLQGILERLNLIGREIDYLKIDIEGYEINFFKDIFSTSPELLRNIKQIGMEIHPGVATTKDYLVTSKSKFHQLWNGMHQLECTGFKLLKFDQNLAGRNPYRWKKRKVSACSEVVWGKVPS